MQGNWTTTRSVTFDRRGALEMDEIARTVFAPIYPVIARNALAATGIAKGMCLDLGSGPAMLSISIARQAPEMEVVAYDFCPHSCRIGVDNIRDAGLRHRIRSMAGDVHAMPFKDGWADLIVSRGSMFFWKDLRTAFHEIFRVLSAGGTTYIGGGFGSIELKEQIVIEMAKRAPQWVCCSKKRDGDEHIGRFKDMFRVLGCDTYKIVNDGTGFWVVLSKHK